jgi:hypothetical protein
MGYALFFPFIALDVVIDFAFKRQQNGHFDEQQPSTLWLCLRIITSPLN